MLYNIYNSFSFQDYIIRRLQDENEQIAKVKLESLILKYLIEKASKLNNFMNTLDFIVFEPYFWCIDFEGWKNDTSISRRHRKNEKSNWGIKNMVIIKTVVLKNSKTLI